MSITRGVDVKVGIKNGASFEILAGQRGATLNRSSEVVDVTNKVSGGWKENLAGAKEWSLECNGVFVADDASLAKLEEAFNTSAEVDVKIFNGTWGYEGKALITDFPVETPYDDAATYTVTLQGTGALNKVTV